MNKPLKINKKPSLQLDPSFFSGSEAIQIDVFEPGSFDTDFDRLQNFLDEVDTNISLLDNKLSQFCFMVDEIKKSIRHSKN